MAAPAPLAIPGYIWDGKRFYKAPKSAAKHTPTSQAKTSASASSSAATSSNKEESEGRRRKRARRTQEKGKWRAVEPPQPNAWGLRELAVQGGRFEGAVGARERLQHDLRSLSLSRSTATRTLFPDCLPLDDSITHLSFDERCPSILRVGGSNGIIASGNLARETDETAYFPNDEERWRTGWFFPSKITSLQTCGDRVLATCLGPPAQAVVGTTTDSISLASVTLAPRKTSLWTSALSRNLVALGCDKKVLVTSDPSQPGGQMDGYLTGGNRGDGTVFALDIYEDLILAGTRKGKVQLFDRRSTRPSPSSSSSAASVIAKDELNINLASSVTHLRHLKEQPHLLLAAGMDGSLALYDLRFPPRPSPHPSASSPSASNQPFLKLPGHVNSFTQGLGFDVWKDEFVVAAGQDSKLRLWSLRSGRLLSPSSTPPSSSTFSTSSDPHRLPSHLTPSALSALSSLRTFTPSPSPSLLAPDPPANPFVRTWEEPLKAVRFSPLDPLRTGRKAYAELCSIRKELEEGERWERERELMRWGMPSLWVANGGGVEGFVAG
ncbi:hypothetical protein JCM10213_009015 [Rhodosporidiobolus nylandii]